MGPMRGRGADNTNSAAVVVVSIILVLLSLLLLANIRTDITVYIRRGTRLVCKTSSEIIIKKKKPITYRRQIIISGRRRRLDRSVDGDAGRIFKTTTARGNGRPAGRPPPPPPPPTDLVFEYAPVVARAFRLLSTIIGCTPVIMKNYNVTIIVFLLLPVAGV